MTAKANIPEETADAKNEGTVTPEQENAANPSLGSPSKKTSGNPKSKKPNNESNGSIDDLGNDKDGEGVEKNITRNKMAMVFVIGFFSVLFLIITYAFFIGSQLKELKDTIIAIVGSLSGIIGFVIGYYFKSEQDK